MAALQIVALDTATPQLRAPAVADTYTAPRAMGITPVALTGTADTSSLSIAQTWNTTGTPTAIDLNVTDTASNFSSNLLSLRVGGTSQFRVRKDGSVEVAGGIGVGTVGGSQNFYAANNLGNGVTGMQQSSTAIIGWASGAQAVGSADLVIRRDAANTLAQRNGVNAQIKRVYGTFTDASNHRRLTLAMSAAGVAEVKPEGAGTGATGNVLHISGLPTINPGPGILWNNAGTPAIGT